MPHTPLHIGPNGIAPKLSEFYLNLYELVVGGRVYWDSVHLGTVCRHEYTDSVF